MEQLSKEKIEELKKQHGKIYQATLTYNDATKQSQKLTLTYRAPKLEEIERLQQTAQKSATVANLELLTTIVVHPSTKDITNTLKELPAVVGQFIQQEVLPFLGELQRTEVTQL